VGQLGEGKKNPSPLKGTKYHEGSGAPEGLWVPQPFSVATFGEMPVELCSDRDGEAPAAHRSARMAYAYSLVK
jgi:hypothetical protein